MRRPNEEEKKLFDDANENIEGCTCIDCELNEDCPFSFDLYNTNKDCLADK